MRTALAVACLLAATPALAAERGLDAVLGRALFDRAWVPAPASTRSADGLGPLFNARSCSACHGLRGLSPASSNPFALTLKLGNDPLYGEQIQTFAAPGLEAEGRLLVEDGPQGREAQLVDAPLGPLAADEVEADDDALTGKPISAKCVAHRPHGHKRIEVLRGDLEPRGTPLAERCADFEQVVTRGRERVPLSAPAGLGCRLDNAEPFELLESLREQRAGQPWRALQDLAETPAT